MSPWRLLLMLCCCLPMVDGATMTDSFSGDNAFSSYFTGLSASNAAATLEVGEPSAPAGTASHSLWISFTAPASCPISISTKGSNNSGAVIDTVVSVYTGNAVSALTLVASNDDYIYGDGGRSSLCVFSANQNTVYRIRVDGYSTSSVGTMVLAVQQTPTATIAATTMAAEPAASGTYTVTLNPSCVDQIALRYTMTGTATFNTDYTVPASPIMIPGGAISTPITLNVTDDAQVEGNETAVMTLVLPDATSGSLAAPLVIGTQSSATMIIVDDEQPVVFVDPTATGSNNGTSWVNAYTDLQTALANVAPGNQVWVKKGTYRPTTGADTSISFVLRSGVKYYGGFSGNETSLGQRNGKANATILSGIIGTGNSRTVVTASSVTGLVFDGFTVRDASGGTFGGGISFTAVTGTLSNCLITANAATYGGGVWNQSGQLTVTNCCFVTNLATTIGGGVYNQFGSNAFSNCVFVGNVSQGASYGGGGVFNDTLVTGGTSFTNCTFKGNAASAQAGGGAYNYGSSNPAYINTIFWNNTASISGTENMANLSGGSSSAAHCDFQGVLPVGTGDSGGNQINQDPRFVNAAVPAGADGVFGTADDGLALAASSPCVNAGQPGPASDVVGNARPLGGGTDIGAYEVPIVYVDANAVGANNGQSWANAYADLQAAIAGVAGGAQIWIRTGVYKPTATTDRTISFQLKSGMGLYGGFGGSETALNQRDWKARPTVLSGDIGSIGNPNDNSYHVVVGNTNALLDGLVIRDGRADGSASAPTYFLYGGGLLCATGVTIVQNCTFTANYGGAGGAIMYWQVPGTITGSMFTGNTASVGGAIYGISIPVATSVMNSVFCLNSASGNGNGGAIYLNDSGMSLVNCTLGSNVSTNSGGGIYLSGSKIPALTNCILWGNTATVGAAQIHVASSSATATNCDIQGGLPAGVTGSGNISVDPLFVNPNDALGPDNMVGTSDDGFALSRLSPCIDAGLAGATGNDIAGFSRVGGIDLGAYERVPVIFVRAAASGANNGTSWVDAYTTLGAALAAATPKANEIWVWNGTYYPSGAGRSATFRLVPGVPVYGGFAGAAASMITQRDWAANPTYLSGDVGVANDSTDNAYHVVTSAGNTILDGFVIKLGNANGAAFPDASGGGLLCNGTATTVLNCFFRKNNATYAGGAAYATGITAPCCPVFRSCLFHDNQATDAANGLGGALGFESAGNGVITNCTFAGNSALLGGAVGVGTGASVLQTSNILWGDSSPEVFNNGLSLIAYCDIQGSGGSGGWVASFGTNLGSNVDVNPQFLDPGHPDGTDGNFGTSDDGFRLGTAGPCIDTGYAAGSPRKDLAGNIRPTGTAIDMGCYEGRTAIVAFTAATSGNVESITSANIPVALAVASDLTVTVNYAVTGGTATGADYTLPAGTLTFAPGVTSQSIPLGIIKDYIQEPDETIIITLTNPVNAKLGSTTSHTYTIVNDDAAGITVTPTSGLVTSESGTTASFTIVLTSRPAGVNAVNIQCSSTAPAEGLVKTTGAAAPSVVVSFDGSNWNTPQTVTVVGQPDNIDDGDISFTIVTDPATSGDAAYNGLNPADVSVKNLNIDSSGLLIQRKRASDNVWMPVTTVRTTEAAGGATAYLATDPTSVVTPGHQDSFWVVLNSKPTSDVFLTVASSNIGKAIVAPASLTFTAATWNVRQQVIVTGVDDKIDDAPLATVPYSISVGPATSSDGKYSSMSRSLSGSNDDDDVAGLTLTNMSMSGNIHTTEAGGTVVFQAVLKSQPAGTVTFSGLDTSNHAEALVTPVNLTFTPANWNVPQTVTVTGQPDNTVDGNQPFDLVIPNAAIACVDPNYRSHFGQTIGLINDNTDAPGVIFTPTTGLVTSELGGTATFTVRLKSRPTGPVGFTIQVSNDVEGELSLDGSTFGPSQALTFTATTGQASAGGTAGWNVPITVTVRGRDDVSSSVSVLYYVDRLACTTGDVNYTGLGADIHAVTILNQTQDAPGVTITPQNLTTSESGTSASFTVKLNYQPTAQVDIALTNPPPGEGTLSFTTLHFTTTKNQVAAGNTAGWGVPITVTVIGVDDAIADGDQTYSITATVTSGDGGYSGISVPPVTVTNHDNDVKGVVITPLTGLTTTEAGGVATFAVWLSSQPTGGTVTIPMRSSNHGEGLISSSGGTTPSGTSDYDLDLTFTTSNWNVPKLVTITGQDDLIADGNQAYQVEFHAAINAGGDYDVLAIPATVAVTNLDNDVAGVQLSKGAVAVAESAPAGFDTYTIVLTSQPTAAVTITVDPGPKAKVDNDTSTANGYQTTFSFDSGNWNLPQTVYVYPLDDQVAEGTHSSIINHRAASADASYDNIIIPSVTATITDNDTANVVIGIVGPLHAGGRMMTTEAGGSATFTVALASQPRHNVTVLVTSSLLTEGVVSPAQLTFTPANYATLQTVTVFGVDDAVADGNVNYQATLSTVSADTTYDQFPISPIDMINIDNDMPGITVTPTAGLVTSEASGTAAFTVVLTSQPTADVAVAIASDNTAEGVASAASLTFKPGNWNVPQSVTVTGQPDYVDDGDAAYGVVVGPPTSGDAHYNNQVSYNNGGTAATTTVSLLNQNVDHAGVAITPVSGLVTSESGTTATYTVVLTSKPRPGNTVSIVPTPATQVVVTDGPSVPLLTVSPLSIAFTTANWNVPQIVTVGAINDHVAEGSPGTPHSSQITHAIATAAATADPTYSALPAPSPVSVLITDNDLPGVTVITSTPGGLVTTEAGGTDTFTMVLTSEPTDPVTMALSSTNLAEGQVGVDAVTFASQAVAASGSITLGGQPADGDTVTVSNGVLAQVFAFDNNATVAAGCIPVGIGASVSATRDNLLAALRASALTDLTCTATGGGGISLVTDTARSLTVPLAATGTAIAVVGMDGGANAWNVPATITVRGIDDQIADGTVPYRITIAAPVSADSNYQIPQPVEVAAANRDNDHVGVTVTESPHGVNFPGPPATDLSEFVPTTEYTYTIRLQSQPTGPVVITVLPDIHLLVDTDTGTVGSQNTLTFTAADWTTPKTVHVTPIDDQIAEGTPYNATITHTAFGGGYGGVAVGEITVSITDNEISAPPVITLPGPGSVAYLEQGHGSLVLDPLATVTDPDSQNFQDGNLTVTFTAGMVPGEDVISIRNQGTGAGQVGVSGGTVTYGGIAIGTVAGGTGGQPLILTLHAVNPVDVSLLAVQEVVRNLQYANLSLNPQAVQRTVSMALFDGDGATSSPKTKTIAITLFDDPPTATGGTQVTFTNVALAGQLVGSDPEGGVLTYAKVSDPLKGVLTVQADGSFTYVPQANDHGTYSFQFHVLDAGANVSNTATMTLVVTGGDDARPQILVGAPVETTLGVQQATIVLTPGSRSGAQALQYRLIGVPAGVTATIAPLTDTPTSQTALLQWNITAASPVIGQHYCFGILIIDPASPAATYQPVVLQLVQPSGSG